MEIIDWSSRFNFGGPRSREIQGICIHTTENSFGTPAENVATYQYTSETGSYHRLVDSTGKILIENTDDWTTWSTGNVGNEVLLHVSCVTHAASSRDEWLHGFSMMDSLVWQVRQWCDEYNIPVRHLSPHELVTGQRGICGHDTARIWGSTDHTDPGPGFPWDVLISRVANNQTSSTQKDGSEMNANERQAVDDIHQQLTGSRTPGQYQGWPQLGGRTLVDAVAKIGEKLEIPGFKSPK